MAKINKWSLPALIAGFIVGGFLSVYGSSIVKAATSYVSSQSNTTATTTVAFLAPGTNIATSTYQIDGLALNKVQEMGEIDAISLEVEFVASSSVSQLNMIQQVSDDNINWYTVSQTPIIASGGVTSIPVSSSTAYQWTPGVSGTSSVAFNILAIPTKHERLQFFIGNGTANGAYRVVTILKRNPTTP